jgi:hypothetical protein
MFIPLTHCHEKWKGLQCVESLGICLDNQVEMCSQAILKFFFMNERLEKVCSSSMLPKTMTMHNCTKLNQSKIWSFNITLDESFSHNCVVGLQSCGGNKATWQWFRIVNLRNEDYLSSKIGSNNGPTKCPKVFKVFGRPKCAWIIAKCLANVVFASRAS